MTPPLVSVVVPVFRTEEYLPACLASLLRQTLPDFEVVVVDDASPGDVAGVVARAVAADPRVRLVRHEENQGVGLARVTGARAARGPFLSFVDSDDAVDERFLETLHAAAIHHGADLVQCGIVVHEPDGTTFCVNRGGAQHELRGDAVVRALLGGTMSNTLGNKLVAAGTFLSGIDELVTSLRGVTFAEDLLTLFVLVTRARCFAHVPDPLYRYLRRTTSVTLTEDASVLVRNVESLGRVYDHVRSVLACRADPPLLVHDFFEREFVVPAVNHFWRAREAGTGAPAGLPASPAALGLLGALVAHSLFVDDAPASA
ncbi:MAG: glycosyltransferase family 2 protein [Acidobacteria bacterium]|nr:glycosyltransferase family 2 protein [Acidobacteriota bacterium]